MFKLNIKIYIILLAILGILVIVVFSYSKRPITNAPLPVFPTPTRIMIVPPTGTQKIIITPRFTGANVNIPLTLLNAAQQKQALKKKTPLTETGFTITYDYQTDVFVVTLSEPKQDNRSVFAQWLKQNYSLIPINKFSFK